MTLIWMSEHETLERRTHGLGSVVASNAGLILFGKDASRARLVPDARVRCARFRGTTKAEILDQLELGVVVRVTIPNAPLLRGGRWE